MRPHFAFIQNSHLIILMICLHIQHHPVSCSHSAIHPSKRSTSEAPNSGHAISAAMALIGRLSRRRWIPHSVAEPAKNPPKFERTSASAKRLKGCRYVQTALQTFATFQQQSHCRSLYFTVKDHMPITVTSASASTMPLCTPFVYYLVHCSLATGYTRCADICETPPWQTPGMAKRHLDLRVSKPVHVDMHSL